MIYTKLNQFDNALAELSQISNANNDMHALFQKYQIYLLTENEKLAAEVV